MYQYRQALVRLRRGETDREIARSKSMGRRKLAALRELARQQGWLDPQAALPDDAGDRRSPGRTSTSQHDGIGPADAPRADRRLA